MFVVNYVLIGLQIFVGNKSGYINIYGIQMESEGPNALHDFLCNNGAPIDIRHGQSKMQQSIRWTNWVRKYVIADQWSEAYMQQQNPAEASIRIIKHQLEVLLERTGTPDEE